MLKFIDIVINARKYYMGCIYDDFECCISFVNSKIVRDVNITSLHRLL